MYRPITWLTSYQGHLCLHMIPKGNKLLKSYIDIFLYTVYIVNIKDPLHICFRIPKNTKIIFFPQKSTITLIKSLK